MKKINIFIIFTIGLIIISLLSMANQFTIDAAVFDAPLLPENNNQYNLGYINQSNQANQRWKNGFFSGNFNTIGNISIGTTTIKDRLYVNNGSIAQELNNGIAGISLIGTYTYGPNECNFGWNNYSPMSIKISGKYAYVVEASFEARCLGIFDISNPALPQRVGYANLGSWPQKVAIAGRYAYIVGSNTSFIVDISNVKKPTILSSDKLGTREFGNYIYVSGLYAYTTGSNVGSNRFYINNIANPLQPIITGSLTIPNGAKSIYGNGNYVYIIDENENLVIINISNPNNPLITNTYSLSSKYSNLDSIYVSGKYAYLAARTALGSYPAIDVIDISNPSNPQPINFIILDTYYGFDFTDIYVSGKYAYIGRGDYDGKITKFYIIDIINPNSIKKAATYELSALTESLSSLAINGRYAYITAIGLKDKIFILDISGIEAVSANIHSLEAGNLQVRNDIIAQGQLQIGGGINVGSGGIFSAGPIGVSFSSTTASTSTSAYFQGRVGIAATTPSQKLEVNGGIRLNPDGTQPDNIKPVTCDASTRGTLWFTPSDTGVADNLEICNSSSTAPDGYWWKKLY